MEETEFLNVNEAASLLHYSPKYLRKLVFLRQVPYLKLKSGRILFDRDRLIEWARGGAVEPISERADALIASIGG
ncbi:MAG: helix-turn-helix domain-containing protein [Rectinema sp.]